MSEVWPISLPQKFEQNGYRESVADNLIEVQPDTGPPISRRRSTAAIRPVGGTMVITEEQLATFKNFFNNTIFSGALPFTFPAQFNEIVSPDLDWLVKFTKSSMPSWVPIGGGYLRLTLTLVILP